MRHLDGPVAVNLGIRFSADDAGVEPGVPADVARSARADETAMASRLPPGGLKRLQDLDAKVMTWLAKDEANRLLFASDPLAALLKIDNTLDAAFIKQLRRASEAEGPRPRVDARIQLKSVRLSVGTMSAAGGGKPQTPKK